MSPTLSIIIPAYNEAERIGTTIDSTGKFVSTLPYEYEIIVVDDGSTDNTADVVNNKITHIPHLSLLSLAHNTGKGAAVRAGMRAVQGRARLFMDADNSTSVEQVLHLLPFLEQGYDVVIGSRRIEGAEINIEQGFIRDTLGGIFRMIRRWIVPLSFADTQAGFKIFSARAAEEIFPLMRTSGWSFDVEVLMRAQKMGFKIKEVPIVWKNDARSKVRFHHMPRMLWDLIKIRFIV